MGDWNLFLNRETRYMSCDECGSRMRRVKDQYGNWDWETYMCPKCASQYDEDYDDMEDEMEEGCRACGNPDYPKCKYSCSLFDD